MTAIGEYLTEIRPPRAALRIRNDCQYRLRVCRQLGGAGDLGHGLLDDKRRAYSRDDIGVGCHLCFDSLYSRHIVWLNKVVQIVRGDKNYRHTVAETLCEPLIVLINLRIGRYIGIVSRVHLESQSPQDGRDY